MFICGPCLTLAIDAIPANRSTGMGSGAAQTLSQETHEDDHGRTGIKRKRRSSTSDERPPVTRTPPNSTLPEGPRSQPNTATPPTGGTPSQSASSGLSHAPRDVAHSTPHFPTLHVVRREMSDASMLLRQSLLELVPLAVRLRTAIRDEQAITGASLGSAHSGPAALDVPPFSTWEDISRLPEDLMELCQRRFKLMPPH